MGKLVVTEFVSVDGVFEDPGGDPDLPTELMAALQSNDGSAGPFIETVDTNLIPATGGI